MRSVVDNLIKLVVLAISVAICVASVYAIKYILVEIDETKIGEELDLFGYKHKISRMMTILVLCTFMLGLCGTWGALSENPQLMGVFANLTKFIACLLTVGVFVAAYKAEYVMNKTNDKMIEWMTIAAQDSIKMGTVKSVSNLLSCCPAAQLAEDKLNSELRAARTKVCQCDTATDTCPMGGFFDVTCNVAVNQIFDKYGNDVIVATFAGIVLIWLYVAMSAHTANTLAMAEMQNDQLLIFPIGKQD